MAYQAVTLAELQTDLSSRTEGNPWWTPEEARLALNEGLRLWNAATGMWVRKTYPVPVPEDHYVPLDSSITQATRVLWNAVPLEKGSLADFDYGLPGWRAAVAGDVGHPDRPSYWAPVSLTLINIYPAMAFGQFPAVLEVAGVHDTPVLVAAGDFVDLGQEQHDVLLGYALHVLSFKLGGQRLVATYPGWVGFLKAAAAENRQFAASAFYRRLLGLDMQRWLKRAERPVQNPVDRMLEILSQQDQGS